VSANGVVARGRQAAVIVGILITASRVRNVSRSAAVAIGVLANASVSPRYLTRRALSAIFGDKTKDAIEPDLSKQVIETDLSKDAIEPDLSKDEIGPDKSINVEYLG